MKFSHKNCDVEIKPILNKKTKKWYTRYLIIEKDPRGNHYKPFTGTKEFDDKEKCLEFYKKQAILDIEQVF